MATTFTFLTLTLQLWGAATLRCYTCAFAVTPVQPRAADPQLYFCVAVLYVNNSGSTLLLRLNLETVTLSAISSYSVQAGYGLVVDG